MSEPLQRLDIDFSAADLQGRPFEGLSLKGKVVLLDFWAVWCGPCLKAFPTLSDLHEQLAGDNFEVLGVTMYSGDSGDVRAFLTDREVRYPVVVGDEALAEQFKILGYPTYLLVAPSGKIHERYAGDIAELSETIAAEVRSLGRKAFP